MKKSRWSIGDQVMLDNGLVATVNRLIWNGEFWSYECIWFHDGEPKICEFSGCFLTNGDGK